MPPVDVLARRYCATYTYIALSQPYFKIFNKVQTGNYNSIWIALLRLRSTQNFTKSDILKREMLKLLSNQGLAPLTVKPVDPLMWE